jgi:hypothetical protein
VTSGLLSVRPPLPHQSLLAAAPRSASTLYYDNSASTTMQPALNPFFGNTPLFLVYPWLSMPCFHQHNIKVVTGSWTPSLVVTPPTLLVLFHLHALPFHISYNCWQWRAFTYSFFWFHHYSFCWQVFIFEQCYDLSWSHYESDLCSLLHS